MKAKTLAVLISCAIPLAYAQTSAPTKLQVNANTQLELFGVFDVALHYNNAAGQSGQTKLEPDGNSSSRIGVRGSSDLGGGLKVSLWLEGAIGPDSGVGGTTSEDNVTAPTGGGGLTWGRRSTVSLENSLGELRLGRDFVPTFLNLSAFHPFGTNGVGNAGQLFYPAITVRTNVRASNSVAYFLPGNLGGLYGTAMLAQGEQPQNVNVDGNYSGIRLGYQLADLNFSVATGKTTLLTGDYTQSNVGASYKVGPLKLLALWGQNAFAPSVKPVAASNDTTAIMGGLQYDIGAGQIRAAYTDLKANGVANDATQVSLGYVHKIGRASLYATGSQVSNAGTGTKFKVGGGQAPATKGGESTGFDLGVVYAF